MTVRLTRKSANDLRTIGWEGAIAEALQRHKRAIARLEAVRTGEMRLIRVRVKAHKVPGFKVAAHWRHIPTRKP